MTRTIFDIAMSLIFQRSLSHRPGIGRRRASYGVGALFFERHELD